MILDNGEMPCDLCGCAGSMDAATAHCERIQFLEQHYTRILCQDCIASIEQHEARITNENAERSREERAETRIKAPSRDSEKPLSDDIPY